MHHFWAQPTLIHELGKSQIKKAALSSQRQICDSDSGVSLSKAKTNLDKTLQGFLYKSWPKKSIQTGFL